MKHIRKYWLLIFGFIFFVSFLFYYNSIFNTNYHTITSNFQHEFYKQQNLLDEYLEKRIILLNKLENQFPKFKHIDAGQLKKEFNLHIYKNDSLIYWNTNKLPILRFAEIHYPANGIVKLQNGWYYAKCFKNSCWYSSCGTHQRLCKYGQYKYW